MLLIIFLSGSWNQSDGDRGQRLDHKSRIFYQYHKWGHMVKSLPSALLFSWAWNSVDLKTLLMRQFLPGII